MFSESTHYSYRKMKVNCRLMDCFVVVMKTDVRPYSLLKLSCRRENIYFDTQWNYGKDTLLDSLLVLRVVSFSQHSASISMSNHMCYSVLGHKSLGPHQYKEKLESFFEDLDITQQVVLKKSVCLVDLKMYKVYTCKLIYSYLLTTY